MSEIDPAFIQRVAVERIKPTCPFCQCVAETCGTCLMEAKNAIDLLSPYLSALTPAQPVATRSVDVGRFTITEHRLKVGCVSIKCNEKSPSAGEGGTFSEAEFEQAIGAFYDKHF